MAQKQTRNVKKTQQRQLGTKPRQLSESEYKSFKFSKKIRHPGGPVKGAFRILGTCLAHLWHQKWLFVKLAGIYLALSLLLVREFNLSTDVTQLRDEMEELFQGATSQLLLGLGLFGALVESSATAPSPAGSAYGSMILVMFSLAVIWAFRQTYAGSKVSLKDCFYKGMYPVIPYILILVVMALQMLPMLIGMALYGIVAAGGLAVNLSEQLVWAFLFGGLVLLSLYMLASSVFALYIVTLPDMTPMRALRSARELVRLRRFAVMRKILFLPLVLLVLGVAAMLPFLLWLTPAADYVFFGLGAPAIIIAHAYIYTLYRELL